MKVEGGIARKRMISTVVEGQDGVVRMKRINSLYTCMKTARVIDTYTRI